jgi:hypothetical protein
MCNSREAPEVEEHARLVSPEVNISEHAKLGIRKCP